MSNLAAFSLYDYLCRDQQYELCMEIRSLTKKKGQYVYYPHASGYCMYEILEGAVKIGSYDDDGEEITYDVLSQGDFFGNLRYLDENQFLNTQKHYVLPGFVYTTCHFLNM